MWNSLFSQLSVGDLLLSGALGFALGGGTGLIVWFVLRKAGLLSRSGFLPRMLVLLYALYLPLVGAAFGTGWQASKSAERQTLAVYQEMAPAVTRYSVKLTESLLVLIERLYPEGRVSVRELMSGAVKSYIEDATSSASWSGVKTPAIFQNAASLIALLLESTLLEEIEDILLEKTANAVSIDAHILQTLWREDILTAMGNGLAMRAIESRISKPYQAARRQFALLTALALAPVLIEIALAQWMKRRRRASHPAPPTP